MTKQRSERTQPKSLTSIAENVWLMRFPLRLLGLEIDRNVTIIRLRDGRLIIHSSAPFDAEDIAQIRSLGEPAWLIDATLFHDSFAKQGRAAFPSATYLAPEGFEKVSGVAAATLAPPPAQWGGEIEVLAIGGIPKVREHVLIHRPSRTLIVCDLVFNFTGERKAWARFVIYYFMRLPRLVGTSLFMRLMVRDKAAFAASIRVLMHRDFHRLIVGHGRVVESGAKEILREALQHIVPDAFKLNKTGEERVLYRV